MNPETVLQEEYTDKFQWATEFGYLNGFPASSPPAPPDADRCHQLMIFTGQHAGASLPLADGTYSMGRSYECDIVLKEAGVEPVHLVLICNAGTIALRPELGAVYLDGQLVPCETVLPEPPAVVTIAGIHFGLAVGGAVWSPLDLPRISPGRSKNAGSFPGKKKKEQIGGDKDRAPQPVETDTINNHFRTALSRLQKAGTLSKIVPLVFILLFMISTVFLFNIKAPENSALIMGIEKQFSERHLPKPAIQIDAEGFLDVTAYVPEVSQKEEITAFLQKVPLAVQSHVYADDEVKRALQDYISRMGLPVEAAYQGKGRASVKGFVENQQEADVVKNLLKSNVVGLHTVDLHVLPLGQVRTELTAALEDADLTDKIDLRPQSGHLLAIGTLDSAARARWQDAKKTIIQRLGQPLAIIDQIKGLELQATIPGKIDIPIAGVTMQPYPFITLQDGKVYFKGASLKNGTVIKEIGQKRIVVEINGKDYYYNF
jgi:type III secretion system YscD/HrpQ family protein